MVARPIWMAGRVDSLKVARDPHSIRIEAGRPFFPEHLVCLIAKGPDDSIYAGDIVDLHVWEAVIACRDRFRMVLAATDGSVDSF